MVTCWVCTMLAALVTTAVAVGVVNTVVVVMPALESVVVLSHSQYKLILAGVGTHKDAKRTEVDVVVRVTVEVPWV